MAGELDPCFEDILLENVNHCPNEETVAGMSIKLYYIPAPHIATFTKPPTTGAYEVIATIPPTGLVPVTGKGWKKIDCQVDKNILQNMTVGSVGNLKLKGELDVVFPGFKKKLVGFQKAHRNTPMIFGMPDSEGQMWIIGNPDAPSNFTSMTLTSGDTGEADSNLTSKINAKTSILAYDGDLTILPDTP